MVGRFFRDAKDSEPDGHPLPSEVKRTWSLRTHVREHEATKKETDEKTSESKKTGRMRKYVQDHAKLKPLERFVKPISGTHTPDRVGDLRAQINGLINEIQEE